MNHVSTIHIENLQNKVRVARTTIRRIVFAVLSRHKDRLKDGEKSRINIYFVSDKKIIELNRKYLNKSGATDVIAFDISLRTECIMADIFISADTAVSNAKKFDTTPDHELCLYAVHGVLHLLGFDDTSKTKERVMRQMENEIMEKNYGNL